MISYQDLISTLPHVEPQTRASIYKWVLILCLAIGLRVVVNVFQSVEDRMTRLGGEVAPIVPSWAPFGLDLAVRALREIKANNYYEYVRDLLEFAPGRTIEFHMVDKRMIITDHPLNIKAMLSTQFDSFGKGDLTHKIFRSCFEGSIFGTEGEAWAKHRSLLRPHVAKDRPTDSTKLELHFQRMIRNLPLDESTVDATHVLDAFLCDVALDIFIDPSSDPDFRLPDPKPFLKGVHVLFKYNTFRVALGKLTLILPDIVACRKSAKELYSYLDVLVHQVKKIQKTTFRSKPLKEWSVMETLANEESSQKVYRSQLITILSAAKDPLGLIVLWIIYELARNSQLVKDLRAEIESTIGPSSDAIPTAAQLKSMTFLQNIIKETLRLYHPFGFNIRSPNKDTTLPTGGGIDGTQPIPVLAETMIVVNILGLQRRVDIVGPDAEEFCPQRWETFKPDPWEYLPYNRGPRNCLGQVFANYAMAYVLVRLYQNFDIVAADDTVQRVMIEMNTRMSDPIHVKFISRKKSQSAEMPGV